MTSKKIVALRSMFLAKTHEVSLSKVRQIGLLVKEPMASLILRQYSVGNITAQGLSESGKKFAIPHWQRRDVKGYDLRQLKQMLAAGFCFKASQNDQQEYSLELTGRLLGGAPPEKKRYQDDFLTMLTPGLDEINPETGMSYEAEGMVLLAKAVGKVAMTQVEAGGKLITNAGRNIVGVLTDSDKSVGLVQAFVKDQFKYGETISYLLTDHTVEQLQQNPEIFQRAVEGLSAQTKQMTAVVVELQDRSLSQASREELLKTHQANIQNMQAGFGLVSTVAQACGHDNLGMQAMTVGNASVQIFDAVTNLTNPALKTLTAFASCTNIASAVFALVSLFGSSQEDGTQLAFKAVFKQLEEISKQIEVVRREMKEEFADLRTMLEHMHEGIKTGLSTLSEGQVITYKTLQDLDEKLTKLQLFNYRGVEAILDQKYRDSYALVFRNRTIPTNASTLAKFTDHIDSFFLRACTHSTEPIRTKAIIQKTQNRMRYCTRDRLSLKDMSENLTALPFEYHIGFFQEVANLPEFIELPNMILWKQGVTSYLAVLRRFGITVDMDASNSLLEMADLGETMLRYSLALQTTPTIFKTHFGEYTQALTEIDTGIAGIFETFFTEKMETQGVFEQQERALAVFSDFQNCPERGGSFKNNVHTFRGVLNKITSARGLAYESELTRLRAGLTLNEADKQEIMASLFSRGQVDRRFNPFKFAVSKKDGTVSPNTTPLFLDHLMFAPPEEILAAVYLGLGTVDYTYSLQDIDSKVALTLTGTFIDQDAKEIPFMEVTFQKIGKHTKDAVSQVDHDEPWSILANHFGGKFKRDFKHLYKWNKDVYWQIAKRLYHMLVLKDFQTWCQTRGEITDIAQLREDSGVKISVSWEGSDAQRTFSEKVTTELDNRRKAVLSSITSSEPKLLSAQLQDSLIKLDAYAKLLRGFLYFAYPLSYYGAGPQEADNHLFLEMLSERGLSGQKFSHQFGTADAVLDIQRIIADKQTQITRFSQAISDKARRTQAFMDAVPKERTPQDRPESCQAVLQMSKRLNEAIEFIERPKESS